MSEGWVLCQVEYWQYLLYWDDVLQCEFILGGWCVFDLYVLVCYFSYYEVDVYVCWWGLCLFIEFEWEVVVVGQLVDGYFVDVD